jgi:hypothetical protein
MSPKTQKTAKNRNLKVSEENIRVMRTVGDQEAFYFYEAVGKPTGESASNLSQFLERVNSVKTESLLFHLERGDFQNWIEKTIGDSGLAKEIGRISPSKCKDIRAKMRSVIERKIEKLNNASLKVIINDDITVTSLTPMT